LEPSNDRTIREETRHSGQHLVIRERLERDRGSIERRGTFVRVEGGSEVCVPHLEAPGIAKEPVVGQERGSQGTARIASNRLHENVAERRFGDDPTVHHRIERDAAGQAEIFLPGLLVQRSEQMEDDVLEHDLCAGGYVLMAL
jgi:hypothetical protein